MQRARHGRTTETHSPNGAPTGRARQRAVMIAALPDGRRPVRAAASCCAPPASPSSARRSSTASTPHPNTYLGPGKLEEVKALAKAADANVVACDDELSPRQERNLEKELGVAGRRPHGDRSSTSSPATRTRPRASSRSSSRSSSTTSRACAGCGPTSSASAAASAPAARASRRSRPTAASRATASPRCAAGSSDVKGSRATMRAERERAHLPQIALAGYTNAGKSTLLNALTGAEVGVRDRLFHTLDPTTRSLRDRRPPLPADRHRRLHPQAAPPARRRVRRDARGDAPAPTSSCTSSTRSRREDELARDAAGRRRRARGDRRRRAPAPARAQQGRPLDDERRRELGLPPSRTACSSARRPGRASTSCASASRTSSRARCATIDAARCRTPRARRLAELHDVAGDLEREDTAEGVRVRARVPPTLAERFARYASGVDGAAGRQRREQPRERALQVQRLRRRRAVLPTPRARRRRGLRPLRRSRPRRSRRASGRMVPTGIAIALPPGHAGLVLPRSGLAARHGIALVNAPGPHRRGLPRRAARPAAEHRPRASRSPSSAGDRIAQLVLVAVATPEVVEVDELGETARAAGGFGSSGR